MGFFLGTIMSGIKMISYKAFVLNILSTLSTLSTLTMSEKSIEFKVQRLQPATAVYVDLENFIRVIGKSMFLFKQMVQRQWRKRKLKFTFTKIYYVNKFFKTNIKN